LLLSARVSQIRATDEAKRQRTIDNIANHMAFAERTARRFDETEAPADSTLAAVSLSVRLLLFHLNRVLGFDVGPTPALTALQKIPLSTSLLLSQLRKGGQCPKRMSIICQNFQYPELLLLSSLRRNRQETHLSCTQTTCNEQPGSFIPKSYHRTEGCDCVNVGPLMSDVVKIIKAGGIPLISMSINSVGLPELRAVKCARNSRYIAISHVWSDKQLCSENNTLPHCQLEHLGTILSELPVGFGHGMKFFHQIHLRLLRLGRAINISSNLIDNLFWLDTLCIPSDSEYKELRQKAINQMDFIYARASQVLVLDRELQNLQCGTEDILSEDGEGWFSSTGELIAVKVPEQRYLPTILGHIYRSAWMSRAWTLQEGVIGSDCIFQLQDCTLRLRQLSSSGFPNYQTLSETDSLIPWASWIKPFVPHHLLIRGRKPADHYIFHLNLAITIILNSIFSLRYTISVLCSGEYPGEMSFVELGHQQRYSKSATSLGVCRSLGKHIISSLDSNILNSAVIENQEQHFISTWNRLLGRSTTKPEDLHIIIANLTGFSASNIHDISDSGDRMKSILFALDRLPLDILFVNGPKHFGSGNPDGWVPLAPCDQPLHGSSTMCKSSKGYLLQFNQGVESSHERVTPVQDTSMYYLSSSSDCSVKRFKLHNSNSLLSDRPLPESKSVIVECLTASDGFVNITAEHHCIIIETPLERKSSGSVCRGALLKISRPPIGEMFLQYQCAVRLFAGNASEDIPAYHLNEVSFKMNLWLESSKSPCLLNQLN
jgi:Heterokaryon incompatibility protein (HET)